MSLKIELLGRKWYGNDFKTVSGISAAGFDLLIFIKAVCFRVKILLVFTAFYLRKIV
jgi:hypothetical protein